MIFRRCIINGLLLALLLGTGSCAIHSTFPFICFERACVKGLGIGAFTKRIKGKIAVMNRKRNAKKPGASAKSYFSTSSTKEEKEDSSAIVQGRNVDYFRYLLFFRLKQHPQQLDSLLIEHTSEYKTIIEVDQSRLNYMIDTMRLRNILTVYIKAQGSVKDRENEQYHLEKDRTRSISKFLRKAGIASDRIKVLQDSLSPPRL